MLEFLQGIESRPCLRKPLSSEKLTRHGTRVSVRLLDKTKLFRIEKRSLDIFSGLSTTKEAPITLAQVVGALAPALEVDVYTQDVSNVKTKTVAAGDWREIAPLHLIDRIAPGRATLIPQWLSNEVNLAASNLSPIVGANGEIQGRCAIVENTDSLFGLQAGIVSVGGLYGGVIHGMAGIMVGKQADLLNRSVAIPIVEQDALAKWAENQATLLRLANQLTWKKSARLLALGAAPDELLVIAHGTDEWTANRLENELNDLDEIWLLEDREYQYQSDCDEVLRSDFERFLELDPRVLIVKSGVATNEFLHSTNWPNPFFKDCITQPAKVFEKIVNDEWPDCELIEEMEKTIGRVSGVSITRNVEVILKSKRVAGSA